jgi:acyl-CoA thioesterase I
MMSHWNVHRPAAPLKTFATLIALWAGQLGCEPSPSTTSYPEPTVTSDFQASSQAIVHLDSVSTIAPSQSDDRPRIVAFGDSLTAGLGVPQAQSYPMQLQKRLDTQGYSYQVINAGVSGETSAGGLRRVSWLLAAKPHLVILELGANDGLRGLSLSETQSHLDQIIRKFKEAHVPVLLTGMKLPPNYGEDYRTAFEAMYRDLAAAHGLPLIPFVLEGVAGEKALNQSDGIHPTAEGYRIVVDNVLVGLIPMLNGSKNNHSKEGKKTRNSDPAP